MIVRCICCYRVYDDAEFLTICPHDEHVSGMPYCRRHDLFNCPICKEESDIRTGGDLTLEMLQAAYAATLGGRR
jgi:Zn finger protein HypA/HybF involved in hydrogenase expression